ncbi:hypothetical protein N7340_18365, partial [Comamonas aquatica]|nr:hypothetical protein [Comamonas aquatica]MDH0373701.1 hypothetical protein [Comamonas aquatica]MDH1447848.1 hypothetical protein [Comamonas aquatica]MDH1816193.1 hypothetical protein [Comamonas aquatica]
RHRYVSYRGLSKNTQQLHTLFALANLWMARARLLMSSPSTPVMPAKKDKKPAFHGLLGGD